MDCLIQEGHIGSFMVCFLLAYFENNTNINYENDNDQKSPFWIYNCKEFRICNIIRSFSYVWKDAICFNQLEGAASLN